MLFAKVIILKILALIQQIFTRIYYLIRKKSSKPAKKNSRGKFNQIAYLKNCKCCLSIDILDKTIDVRSFIK